MPNTVSPGGGGVAPWPGRIFLSDTFVRQFSGLVTPSWTKLTDIPAAISTFAAAGTLGWGALPSGSGSWTGNPTIGGTLTVTGAVQIGSSIYPGTFVAGDILYASGVNTPAALAKGSARALLQTNAAGTLPEWTQSIAISGSLSINGASDLTGTVTARAKVVLNGSTAPSLSQSNNKITLSGQGTGVDGIYMSNTTGTFVVGIEGSGGGQLCVGSTAYACIVGSVGTTPLQLMSANHVRLTLTTWGSLIFASATPGTQTDGEVWYDGADMRIRLSSTSKYLLAATSANAVSPTAPNRTITVSLGGTTYYIAAKTTND